MTYTTRKTQTRTYINNLFFIVLLTALRHGVVSFILDTVLITNLGSSDIGQRHGINAMIIDYCNLV